MLNYKYTASKLYCEQIGLFWFGDDYAGLIAADKEAKALGLTQDQVDGLMRQHLWQVRQLFEPKNYSLLQRLGFAFYFLTGIKWLS